LFSPYQLARDRPVAFVVHGNGGRLLRVKVNLGQGDPTQSVTAQLPDKSQELKALREGGDSSGNFIYRLPETGDYPVEFDSGGRESTIEFSFLASDDPMIAPGIKPEDISIDFGRFAQKKEMKTEFFGQWQGMAEEWQPSHWAVQNRHLEFRIMPVAGYRKVFADPDSKSDLAAMENLEASLKPGATVPADLQLPYPGFGDAAMIFSTRPQLLQGEGWRGLRRIGAFAQDDGCIFGPDAHLGYVFEGLSDDGRFFILMRAWVSNRSVGALLQKKCTAGAEAAGRDSDPFFKKEMPALFDEAISTADPASFHPHLEDLDVVVRSLKLGNKP
jgi:hypothetical protein